MHAVSGLAYACVMWLQALQYMYMEKRVARKHNLATKWAQCSHVNTPAFQTALSDSSDNENKEWEERGRGKRWGVVRKVLCAVNNPLKRKKEVENKQMKIKTMVKRSSPTWMSAAGSKLCSASACTVCEGNTHTQEMKFAVCVCVCFMSGSCRHTRVVTG